MSARKMILLTWAIFLPGGLVILALGRVLSSSFGERFLKGLTTITKLAFLTSAVLVITGLLGGCGGGSQTTQPLGPQSVSLSIRDNPPAGVSVLSFEINFTGANLQSSDASKPAVPLVSSPIEVELEQLETEKAFLNAVNAPVNNLPVLFTSNGVNQVQVQTSSATEFEGVSGVSSLAVGNNLALRGLLFKAAGDPILVAKKVRKT